MGTKTIIGLLGAALWLILVAILSRPPVGNAAEQSGAPISLAALPRKEAAAGKTLVGDAACYSCHEAKASYAHTAHAKTSSVATRQTIHGSFAPGTNRLRTVNPDLFFVMETKEQRLVQTGVLRKPNQVLTRSEPFDIVVGSGRKGQSYLFWDANQLFQLPVSYWTELGAWVNSPGYIDGTADFDRPIAPRCLECHATSFESRAPPENAYNKPAMILGISCEKCHGPGGEHVARYRSATPPASVVEAAIVNPARLSRERQMDACALCHAGIGHSLTSPLSFTAGDALSRHLVFPPLPPNAHLDVHASQVQLLERSRCFQASKSMTCTTCHDVHATQRDVGVAAKSCMACHPVEKCGAFAQHGQRIAAQCVSCHMPDQVTAQIISSANGRKLQPKVRNHHIAIYPDRQLP